MNPCGPFQRSKIFLDKFQSEIPKTKVRFGIVCFPPFFALHIRIPSHHANIFMILFRFSVFAFILSLSYPLLAQTPPPGLDGPALRSWLKTNFFDGKHTDLGYSTARSRMYGHIDNVNNSINCVYGGYAHPWQQGSTGTNPAPVNTEHTIPQAFFGGSGPIRSDIHHLFPTFDQWNSNRASLPFGEIPDNQTTNWMRLTQSQSNVPSTNIDEYSEGTNATFEPREDHKGDCARAIFYIFTMYSIPNHDIHDLGDITALYQWHQQDPPSSKETQRNDAIENWQGNRNPYIDHPEWVGPAWGFGVPAPDMPTNVQIVSDTNQLTISWDDVAAETGYFVYRSTDNNLFSLLDSVGANVTNYVDTNVVGGLTYFYYVVAYNDVGNSPNSASVSGSPITGTGSGGFATELLISEYIEGELFNKALEIANGTGSAIDLGSYSLKKQLNGSGAWGDEYVLSGMLADGEVWIIASSAADAGILAQADVSSSSNLMIFNGNDPIGLFRNDSLIDIVGEFDGGGVSFGQDVTLVRKSSVVEPNDVYQEGEWEVFPTNHTDHLGWHVFEPDATALDNWFSANKESWLLSDLRIWPNPVRDQLWISFELLALREISFRLEDQYGREVHLMQIARFSPGKQLQKLPIPPVATGLYFLRIQVQEEVHVYKVWKSQ